jgi:hypothetical protein
MMRITWLAILMGLLSVSVNANNNGDPLVGRWRLDVASSSFSSGRPPMAEFLTIATCGPGLVINLTTVDSRGRLQDLKSLGPVHASDGDVSILAADDKRGTHSSRVRVFPWIDKMALERLSPRSARAIFRKGDAVRFTVVAAVDDTARALTWEQAGTDIDARPFNDRLVFRRQ